MKYHVEIGTKAGFILRSTEEEWTKEECKSFEQFTQELFRDGADGVFSLTETTGQSFIPVSAVDYVRVVEGF